MMRVSCLVVDHLRARLRPRGEGYRGMASQVAARAPRGRRRRAKLGPMGWPILDCLARSSSAPAASSC